jgi:hypothetical protein
MPLRLPMGKTPLDIKLIILVLILRFLQRFALKHEPRIILKALRSNAFKIILVVRLIGNCCKLRKTGCGATQFSLIPVGAGVRLKHGRGAIDRENLHSLTAALNGNIGNFSNGIEITFVLIKGIGKAIVL